jgi:hypothetical protein
MNKLEAWRKAKGITYQDMAQRLGHPTTGLVTRWCLHPDHQSYLNPEPEHQVHIQMMTLGEVTPNTWVAGQIDVPSTKPQGGRNGRKQ